MFGAFELMARSTDKSEARGKLLDCWDAPEPGLTPVGCLATSFTFSSEFFEEECIGRFLNLDTEPKDGSVYLIEREDRLAQLVCACAIVDQHHCNGPRSLRWDLVPARPKQGILHAKVAVLRWTEYLRVIIASANLTADGYRRNQEVYGVLDYYPESDAPLACLSDVADFLRECLDTTGLDVAAGSRSRAEEFLTNVESTPENWGQRERTRTTVAVGTLFSLPGHRSAFDQLPEHWPVRRLPTKAVVTSPFFDAPESKSWPAEKLWGVLAQRGPAQIIFNVEAEDLPAENAVLLRAPESLRKAQPTGSRDLETVFRTVVPDVQRPLHAKSILLESDEAISYMLGSSNFTSRGLGLAKNPNYEANLVYSVRLDRDKPTFRKLLKAQLETKALANGVDIQFAGSPEQNEDSEGGQAFLPYFFHTATLEADPAGTYAMVLQFGQNPPESWAIADEDEKRLYGSDEWSRDSSPQSHEIAWPSARPPSGLWVQWGNGEQAWWAINVASQSLLPPPEELRNLPLDVLLRLLTSSRPLHREMEAYLKNLPAEGESLGVPAHLDPHKRVNTSRFLLQRTRRFSGALKGIRERLERPVVSEQSLHWRLHGPIGVMALAGALKRDAHSAEERLFFLGEIILELSRVVIRTEPGCLAPKAVRVTINQVVRLLREEILTTDAKPAGNLGVYLEKVTHVEVLAD